MLPDGVWLDNDEHGTHWYRDNDGNHWHSTHDGYRIQQTAAVKPENPPTRAIVEEKRFGNEDFNTYDYDDDDDDDDDDDERPFLRKLPFIASLLLLASQFLPFYNLGDLIVISGFDMVVSFFDIIESFSVLNGAGEFEMIMLAGSLLSLMPTLNLIVGVLGLILSFTKFRTFWMGLVHLVYSIVLIITSVLGDITIFGVMGLGVWAGVCLGGLLLFDKKTGDGWDVGSDYDDYDDYDDDDVDDERPFLRKLPFIASLLLLASLFLPFYNLGDLIVISGFDMVLSFFDIIESFSVLNGAGEFEILVLAVSLLSLMPIVNLIVGILGLILSFTKFRTFWVGIVHLAYSLTLIATSVLGDSTIFGMMGLGVWAGICLGGLLLMDKKPRYF